MRNEGKKNEEERMDAKEGKEVKQWYGRREGGHERIEGEGRRKT